jgi:hypothetical protein
MKISTDYRSCSTNSETTTAQKIHRPFNKYSCVSNTFYWNPFTRNFCLFCGLLIPNYFFFGGGGKWVGLYVIERFRKLNVLLTCIIVYQYIKTNVIQFLLNLLRINGLYMFRALLAHPQEVPHKRRLVDYVCLMPVGCTRIGVKLQFWGSNIPSAICGASPEDEQVMLKTFRGS